MRVYAYNGVATDNFQVYHSNPSVLPRPPTGCTSMTRPGVNGPICAIAPLTPPPTASLNVGPPTIDRGQSATLTWNTANATTVSIDHGIGVVAASGAITVSPTLTTFYTLTATGTTGAVIGDGHAQRPHPDRHHLERAGEHHLWHSAQRDAVECDRAGHGRVRVVCVLARGWHDPLRRHPYALGYVHAGRHAPLRLRRRSPFPSLFRKRLR